MRIAAKTAVRIPIRVHSAAVRRLLRDVPLLAPGRSSGRSA